MPENVLVIAAHPDDEVLGVGGVIARHADAGDVVHILIVAEGATSRQDSRDAAAAADELATLRRAAATAAAVLGAQPPRFCGLPDNRLDGLDLLDVIKPIEAVVAELRPAVVYTHHGGDLNVDHRVVHAAVMTACRPLSDDAARAIYTFETLSSSEWSSPEQQPAFRPQRFVDITATLKRKLVALQCYDAEMRPFPHPRSLHAVEALAALRGSTICASAAEAFGVVREVVR